MKTFKDFLTEQEDQGIPVFKFYNTTFNSCVKDENKEKPTKKQKKKADRKAMDTLSHFLRISASIN